MTVHSLWTCRYRCDQPDPTPSIPRYLDPRPNGHGRPPGLASPRHPRATPLSPKGSPQLHIMLVIDCVRGNVLAEPCLPFHQMLGVRWRAVTLHFDASSLRDGKRRLLTETPTKSRLVIWVNPRAILDSRRHKHGSLCVQGRICRPTSDRVSSACSSARSSS